jgi:hypothetical protein
VNWNYLLGATAVINVSGLIFWNWLAFRELLRSTRGRKHTENTSGTNRANPNDCAGSDKVEEH